MFFDIQLFADETDTATYDASDYMTLEHGKKIAERTAYLIEHKIGKAATDEEFMAMLNENLPNSPEMTLSGKEFKVAVGESTDVTVTRLGDGAISVEETTALEGVTYSVSDTKITFSNASATEGTGQYAVKVAGTTIFNPASDTITITGTSGS